jgi:hypothetical protein
MVVAARTLTAALYGWGALGCAAWGQEARSAPAEQAHWSAPAEQAAVPAPAEQVVGQVEMYYGLQRLFPPRESVSAPAPPVPPAMAPVVPVVSVLPVPDNGCVPPPVNCQGACSVLRQVSHSQAEETPPPPSQSLPPVPQVVPATAPLPLQPLPAAPGPIPPAPPPPAPEAAKPVAHPEERSAPTTVVITSPAPAQAPPAPVREASEPAPANVLRDLTLLHALIAVAAFVVGPLLSVLAGVFLLRRFTGRNSPLFRVEFVNNGQGLALVGPAAGGTVEAHRVAVPAAEGPPSTAQRFDIGPTYEQELLHRQLAEQQKDEATLRHIFEQNLQLLEQIEAQPEADEGEPEATPGE